MASCRFRSVVLHPLKQEANIFVAGGDASREHRIVQEALQMAGLRPCKRVGMFSFRLGGGGGVSQTALQFQLSEGYVSGVMMEVARLIKKQVRPKYVRWPNPEEQREMSEQWELEDAVRQGISDCCGTCR